MTTTNHHHNTSHRRKNSHQNQQHHHHHQKAHKSKAHAAHNRDIDDDTLDSVSHSLLSPSEFCRIQATVDIFSEGDIAMYKSNHSILMNVHSKKLTSIFPDQRQELSFHDMKQVNLGYGYAIVINNSSNQLLRATFCNTTTTTMTPTSGCCNTNVMSNGESYDPFLKCRVLDVLQLFCRSDSVVQGLNWRTGQVGFYGTKNCIIVSHNSMKKMKIENGQVINTTVKQLQKEFPSNNSRKRVKIPLFKRERSAVYIQRAYRRYVEKKKIYRALRKFREYLNLEREFYTSEKRYIDYLKLIIDLYLVPLRRLAGTDNEIIDSKQISSIFGNIETILGLNQEFYKELLEAKRVKKHLADVLLWFLPYLKLYITFIGQYEDATKMIKSLSNTNVQFRNLLTKSLEDPRSLEGVTEKSQPLGLTDLMPKPLQRMFAYNNMLQRMAEILPREARVYSSVVHVKTEMEKHIMWVNETKRKFENFPKTPTDPSKKKGTFFGVPSQKPKNGI